jgi:DNA-binding response OmpR family regulator
VLLLSISAVKQENSRYSFPDALECIQKKVYLNQKIKLNLQQQRILEAVWNNFSYDDIANSLHLSPGHTRNVSSSLWKLLSEVFEYKINKSHFRELMLCLLENGKFQLMASVDLEDDDQSCCGTILIIDDRIDNLKTLSRLLKKNGYQVRSATGGEDALLYLERNIPDLILLDILMPNMNGYEVCEKIKKNPVTKGIPIIFISAIQEEIDKVKAFRLGGSDYVSKPFQSHEVLARVSYQVKLKKQQEAWEQEIQDHQQTIEMLYQSRLILSSVLHQTRYGIAAFEAVRNSLDGEIVDFRCLLANPAFRRCFEMGKNQPIYDEECSHWFARLDVDVIQPFIEVVKTGKPFQKKVEFQEKSYQMTVQKLGDGINLTLQPLPRGVGAVREPPPQQM